MPNGFVTPYVPGIYSSPNTIPIAEMIRQQGTDAANAQLRSGDIQANLWGNIGQTIAHIPAEVAQARAAGQEAQVRQQQIDTYKQNQAALKTASDVVSQHLGPDGMPDMAAVVKGVSGLPLQVQQATISHAKDLYEIGTKAQADRVDRRADVANTILSSIDKGVDPWLSIASGMAVAKGSGIANDQELGSLAAQITQAPDAAGAKAVLENVRRLSSKYAPKIEKLGEGDTLVGISPSGGVNTIATGAPKPATADEAARADYAAAKAAGNKAGFPSFEAWKSEQERGPVNSEQKSVLLDGKPDLVDYNPRTAVSTKNGVDVSSRVKPIPPAATVQVNGGLTDAALDQETQKYLDSGVLPPGYGRDGVARSTAIMNRAAVINPQAALARNAATFKADSANLTNLQRTEGSLSAFENAAGKNIKQFLDLSAKLPDTGVPWLNTPIRLLDDKLVGAEYLPAVQAARKIALREVARVTNDPGLKGQLTDSARADVNEMVDGNATIAQMKRAFPVLLQDMANVHSGLNDQIATVKAGIGSNPAAVVQQSASPKIGDTKTFPNGRIGKWDGQGWVAQ